MLLSSPRHPHRVIIAALLALTLLTGAAPVAGATPSVMRTTFTSPRWSWPIAAPRVIANPFIAPATPYSSGHRGIDLWAASGASIYAPASGVIHFAGMVAGRAVISIQHAGGLISSFEPVASTLIAGSPVRRGDEIGQLLGASQSGHCGAPCLHFGVRLHGQYVSPLKFLGGIPRSVLLPTRPLR